MVAWSSFASSLSFLSSIDVSLPKRRFMMASACSGDSPYGSAMRPLRAEAVSVLRKWGKQRKKETESACITVRYALKWAVYVP